MIRGDVCVIVAALVALPAIVATPAAAQELPAEAVAQVGEETLSKRDFDRWLRIAARADGGRRAVLDPPRFERCAAAERRRLARNGRRLSRRALRRRCTRRYETSRAEVMQFLLQGMWVRQEAAAVGIAVAPERVRRSFERQKRDAFRSERAYRRFLRRSGMSEADVLFRVELDLLQGRLVQRVAAMARPVTGEEVDRYRANHRRRYRGLSRAAARRRIRVLLESRRQQRAIDAFVGDFRARSRAITACAEEFVVGECGSAVPEPSQRSDT
jgi:foldase protein PrsA